MKIWLDIMTPKQARLMHGIFSALKPQHEFIVTSRENAETQNVLNDLEWETHLVGGHGQTLKEKAENRFKRQLQLTKLIDDEKVDLHISHASPSATNVAYALGIPIILTQDSPWARHVSTLTLPYANYLVCSAAFSPQTKKLTDGKNIWAKYCIALEHIRYFDGIDEVTWIKDWVDNFKQAKTDVPIITIRILEHHAAYTSNIHFLSLNKVLQEIDKINMDFNIEILSRYRTHHLNKIANRENVSVISYMNPLELYQRSAVFVGYGGTMNREAALLGVPSISLHYYYYILPFIHEKGFPAYKCDHTNFAYTVNKFIKSESIIHKQNYRNIIKRLETPVDQIMNLIEELDSNCR